MTTKHGMLKLIERKIAIAERISRTLAISFDIRNKAPLISR